MATEHKSKFTTQPELGGLDDIDPQLRSMKVKKINIEVPSIEVPKIVPLLGGLIVQILAIVIRAFELVLETGALVGRTIDFAFSFLSRLCNTASKYLTAISHKLH